MGATHPIFKGYINKKETWKVGENLVTYELVDDKFAWVGPGSESFSLDWTMRRDVDIWGANPSLQVRNLLCVMRGFTDIVGENNAVCDIMKLIASFRHHIIRHKHALVIISDEEEKRLASLKAQKAQQAQKAENSGAENI